MFSLITEINLPCSAVVDATVVDEVSAVVDGTVVDEVSSVVDGTVVVEVSSVHNKLRRIKTISKINT